MSSNQATIDKVADAPEGKRLQGAVMRRVSVYWLYRIMISPYNIAISYLDESWEYDVLLGEKSVSLQERMKRIENASSANGGCNRDLT
jgi:hypothetical protein